MRVDGDGDAASGGSSPLDVVADELYRLPLEEFIPVRDARAKAARGKDRALAAAVGKLRKPSSAAWVVNLLVHERPELLEQLSDLADALRAAQESLSGDQIRGLSAQRHQVVASMVRESRRLAAARGVKVGDAVQRELEATFDAALADPAAAQAVRSGRLTTALSYAGLGDLGSATTVAPDTSPTKAIPSRARAKAGADAAEAEAQRRAEAERRRQEHEQALRGAEAALAEAVAARDEADAARDQVRVDHEDAQQRVEELQQQLEQAQRHVGELAAQERDGEKAAARAGRTADAAQRRVTAAREALERLPT